MITIGVDESGTGAWAGSFTVCALAGYMRDSEYLTGLGVTDSKKLSDKRRRALCADIVGYSLVGCVEEVTAEEYNTHGKTGAWRLGMSRAIEYVVESLIKSGIDPVFALVIDGNEDEKLLNWIHSPQSRHQAILWTRFIPKADSKYAFVAGASILAKTHRNDLMLQLHDTYPEYGWSSNMGYGTAEHQEALEAYGKTCFHRRVKPVRNTPDRVD